MPYFSVDLAEDRGDIENSKVIQQMEKDTTM